MTIVGHKRKKNIGKRTQEKNSLKKGRLFMKMPGKSFRRVVVWDDPELGAAQTLNQWK